MDTFFTAATAIISDQKSDFWLVGMDVVPAWLNCIWRQVTDGQIVKYTGVPFGVNVSFPDMWD